MSILQILIWMLGLYLMVKLLPKLWKLFGFGTSGTDSNPFQKDSSLPIKPKVIDQKLRDLVLKQNFKEEKVPNNLDAIIIGSGIGGLTTAAVLSKIGKKVLILEQHDQAGGTCHTFIEKGYEFDVGVHYIGQMNRQTINKTMLDQISDGQIEWSDLDENFDTIVFKEGNKVEKFPVVGDPLKQKNYLKKEFPDEKQAIDRYYEIVDEVYSKHRGSMFVKFLPLMLIKIIDFLGIIHWFTNYFEWNKKSVKDVIGGLTKNETLRDILSYCFGDYGTVPSEAGFPMQALLTSHYSKGASYPVGGASEIAYNIIPVIERAGGKVLVNAEVSNILVNSEGKAYGIKMKHGTKEYEILAPLIISNAGLYNTVQRFLPREVAMNSRLYPFVQKTKHGVGAMSIFVGLDAPVEELDVPINKNYWVFTKKNVDEACITYMKHTKEECENYDMPLQFISFPSTKDPLWEQKFPGKTSMVIIALVNYDWFQEWEDKPVLRRGDDYDSMKKTIGQKCIDLACDLFPKIKDHIDYVNIGTPLSNNYYLGTTKGEIYGLDHNQNRFSLVNNSLLRPETDIKGLYLTGQDVCSCGVTGAMWGGMLCAQQIIGRNIISDLGKLHKGIVENKEE